MLETINPKTVNAALSAGTIGSDILGRGEEG
jgi:hypothetical protein